ncbi:MAG: diguanylate cyclase [Roseiarcus sp.]
MQRFILQQNIARFQRLLTERTDDASQRTLRSLLASAQRDLAFLNAAEMGVSGDRPLPAGAPGPFKLDPESVSHFEREFGGSPNSYMALDAGPGLHILAINEAYASATMIAPGRVLGKPLFEIFPDNPGDPAADGVSNLYFSLRIAGETGEPHAMPIQRYDVRAPDGQFVERYWRPVNKPVFGAQQRLLYLLHHVEDVTREARSP